MNATQLKKNQYFQSFNYRETFLMIIALTSQIESIQSMAESSICRHEPALRQHYASLILEYEIMLNRMQMKIKEMKIPMGPIRRKNNQFNNNIHVWKSFDSPITGTENLPVPTSPH